MPRLQNGGETRGKRNIKQRADRQDDLNKTDRPDQPGRAGPLQDGTRHYNVTPKLFISHKHSDKEIAKYVANFLVQRSGFRLDIHLSSSPEYQGPRIGRTLTEELRNALSRTDALILIYTTADQDWSYCMWECGVATDPQSKDTNIYVFQCGTDVPAPFADTVLINVRRQDDLKRFFNAFMRDPDFFPGRGEAFLGNAPDRAIEEAAETFYNEIEKHLPPPSPKPSETWRTWPFIKLEIKGEMINRAVEIWKSSTTENLQNDSKLMNDLIDAALVTDYHARIPQLFAKNDFPRQITFRQLVSISLERGTDVTWAYASLEQALRGSQRDFVSVRWAPVSDPASGTAYLPVLCKVREDFSTGTMIFDVYFVDITAPTAIPVTLAMIPIKRSSFKNIDLQRPDTLKLSDISSRMSGEERQRLPLLGSGWRVRFVIHKSLIDGFILRTLQKTDDAGCVKRLTLEDLLHDEVCAQVAANTVAFVPKSATVADAQQAMSQVNGCKDVFVTEDGTGDSAALGWLTDVMIVKEGAWTNQARK